MFLYMIPFQGKYIIYRPLLPLAFVGNRAMADLCSRLYADSSALIGKDERQAYDFLKAAGFLNPDGPPPASSAEGSVYKPTTCVLFPTTRCNLGCTYCYAHGGDNRRQTLPLSMARAAILKICEHAMEQGLERYSLCFHGGGEPTMAWSFLKKCVAYARQQPLPVSTNLTTNGVWTAEKRAWLLDNIDEISLSFDGPAAIQNRQRPLRSGKGSFVQVMKTIEEMDRQGKSYGIRVTVTEENIADIPEIVAFICSETGTCALQVEPAFNYGRARRNRLAVETEEQFARAFLEGFDIACEHRRHMYYSGARPWLLTDRFCEAFSKALIVGPDGFITSCYEVCSRDHDLAGNFHFGNMGRNGGLTLNLQVRSDLLARIGERRQTCRDCFCYFHCAGDCPSKTFSQAMMGFPARGSRCRLNQTITKELIGRYILQGQGIWKGRLQAECPEPVL